jgi:hypothetical protein
MKKWKRLSRGKSRQITSAKLASTFVTILVQNFGLARTIISLLICSGALAGCNGWPLCGDTTHRTVLSPARAYTAEFLVRDCGATTDFVSQVYISRKKWPLTQKELIFVLKGGQNINLEWTGENTLRVSCNNCSNGHVFKKETSWEEVKIDYDMR